MSKIFSWEHKFYEQTFLWMYRARNFPSRVILPTNSSGKFQLEVRDFETNFHRQITKTPQGSIFGSISPSGKFVFYLDDKGGNETGHFVREFFAGGKKVDITPDLPPYFAYEVSSDYADERLCFYASIKDKNQVYLVETDQKGVDFKTKLLYETKDTILGAIISPNGKQTCVSISTSGGKNKSQVLIFDNDFGKLICRISFVSGDFVAQAFSADADKPLILGVLNMGEFYRPVWLDFLKEKIEEIKNPDFKGNVFVLEWLEDQNKILFGQEYHLKHLLLFYDLNKKTISPIGPDYGSLDLFFGSVASLSEGSFLFRWQSFNDDSRIIKLSGCGYQKKTVFFPLKKKQNNKKKKLQSVYFKSSDETPVQMWVAWPTKKRKNYSFVIDIHGGPHGSVGDTFSPEAQILLDQGFGYCAVNYRGSTSFGKDFERAIYGRPGYFEVEDIVSARNWLVTNGQADPDKIILFGWSWGGYVTLLALGKYPNLWAGGIAGTPIGDCFLQYEDEPAFFQAIDRERFGGSPKQKPSVYKESSPVTYANNFTKPALIIYGENDARCPARQIANFINELKSKRKSVKVKKFSAGHTGEFSNTRVRVSNFKEIIKFAKKLTNK